jgi:hypothetical protein
MMPFADQVLVLGPVTGHVAAEIASLGIEERVADVAVGFVVAGVRGQVRQQDLLVHERLGAAGERAFEGAAVWFWGL